MSIKTKKLASRLTGKFGYEPRGGTKHDSYVLVVDGIEVATTRLPRSGREIRTRLLGEIARQMHTSSADLRQMCACHIDRDEYLTHLDSHGLLR